MNGFEFVERALELTDGDVEPLIKLAEKHENEWLEFKAATRPRKGTEGTATSNTVGDHYWHVARAVFAMANGTGGLVVIGIGETEDPSRPIEWCDLGASGFDGDWDAFLRSLDEQVLKPRKWVTNSNQTVWSSKGHFPEVQLRQAKFGSNIVVAILVEPIPLGNDSILVDRLERNINKEVLLTRRKTGYGRIDVLEKFAQITKWWTRRSLDRPLERKLASLRALRMTPPLSLPNQTPSQRFPGRHWTQLRIAGVHYRLMPTPDGPRLTRSPPDGADGLFGDSTLVADAEGRVCACLTAGHLQIAWLNYLSTDVERWPNEITIPADLKLIGITMRGKQGVEVVTSGNQGLRTIRAEYPGTSIGSMQNRTEGSSDPCREAIYHRTSKFSARIVSVHADTGRLTSGEVAFGLESVEFLDAGVTDSGLLVYAAIGRQGDERYLALVWPHTDKRQEHIRLNCGVPKGLVVVRRGTEDDCVLVQADGRVLRMSELTGKVTHATN